MSNSNTLLNGKKVIIIGGSSGIGRSVAAAALAHGASVVIASSTQSKVDMAVELLKKGIAEKDNVTASGDVFDLKDFAALTNFLTKHAPFDHFISTAGDVPQGLEGGRAADVDIRDQFKDSVDVRYWAILNAANHIHKNKLIRPGGSFTMTIGTAQKRPINGWGFFIGVTGAVETATRGLAVDLKPLRVNTICPGLVDTDILKLPGEVRASLFESHTQKVPVGHVGTPEEVAEAYIFAMKCQYLTGQTIVVDGGGVLV